MINKLNIFVHWLPGIALLLKVYSIWGERIFDSFFIIFLVCISCVGASICWLTFSFFVTSLVRNITWRQLGYRDCFYIIFPFVYSKKDGFRLLSTTLANDCALFDSLPKDFVKEQANEYSMERNRLCALCERNAMIAYGVVNAMLAGLLLLDFSWILVLLTIWLQATFMYVIDTHEYKGLYTKYIDYKTDNAVFYLAKSAAYQGILSGKMRTELLAQVEINSDFTRLEFYFYKCLKVQCIFMAVRGGVDDELFGYLKNSKVFPDLRLLTSSSVGQERLEILKILVDSAVLSDNKDQKEWLYLQFSKLDWEFIQSIGVSHFDIWRDMLKGQSVKGKINHKFDQTKQILSDTDIYNRKIYGEYNEAWEQLHDCLERMVI